MIPTELKGEPAIILLVEDDPAHAEIVRRNFINFRMANRLMHVADGQLAWITSSAGGNFRTRPSRPSPT